MGDGHWEKGGTASLSITGTVNLNGASYLYVDTMLDLEASTAVINLNFQGYMDICGSLHLKDDATVTLQTQSYMKVGSPCQPPHPNPPEPYHPHASATLGKSASILTGDFSYLSITQDTDLGDNFSLTTDFYSRFSVVSCGEGDKVCEFGSGTNISLGISSDFIIGGGLIIGENSLITLGPMAELNTYGGNHQLSLGDNSVLQIGKRGVFLGLGGKLSTLLNVNITIEDYGYLEVMPKAYCLVTDGKILVHSWQQMIMDTAYKSENVRCFPM